MARDAGSVDETVSAEPAVPVDPFASAGAGNAHLGGNMGDRAMLTPLTESAAAFDGQRCIGVSHWPRPASRPNATEVAVKESLTVAASQSVAAV